MNYFDEIPKDITSVVINLSNNDEILKTSRQEVMNSHTFDKDNKPIKNGLSDTIMGATHKDNCETCYNNKFNCPCSHHGHIKLVSPVYNYRFISEITKILQTICPICNRIALLPEELNTLGPKYSLKTVVKKILDKFKAKTQYITCPICEKGKIYLLTSKKNNKKINYITIKNLSTDEMKSNILLAEDVEKIFMKIPIEEIKYFGMNPILNHPSNLIHRNIVVAGNQVRPYVNDGFVKTSEDHLTKIYNKISSTNASLKSYIENKNPSKQEKMTHIMELANLVNSLYNPIDNVINATSNGENLKGIFERTKGKTGRLQGNLFAKRVNNSARSVISGDPKIPPDYVGIPIEILKALSFPETVHENNILFLSNLVKNGGNNYPGANAIKIGNEIYDLKNNNNLNNIVLNYGDIVYRHYLENEVVMYNRQPTLHKYSMIGGKIKPVKSKTIRLNLSNTSQLNADFDK